jgi:hypothetical protein
MTAGLFELIAHARWERALVAAGWVVVDEAVSLGGGM